MASPQLENIGLALQGFGAGIQGQGPQFAQGLMQNQNQQQGLQIQQQEAQMRQQGLQLQQQEFQQKQAEAQEKLQRQILEESFKDISIYNSFGQKGDWKSAQGVGLSFLQHAQQLSKQGIQVPQDAIEHAQILTKLATAAMSQDHPDEAGEAASRALDHSSILVKQGQDIGFLQKPKAESSLGKAAQDLRDGLITKEEYQAVAAKETGKEGTQQPMQAVNASTGDIIPIQHDSKSGKYTDTNGKPFSLPEGYVITHMAAPQGNIEGIIPKAADVDLKKKAGSIASFNDTAQQVIDLVKGNPDITTFVSSAASLANTAKAEAQAIGRHIGIDSDVYTPSTYNDVFRELGIKNDVLKSLYTSLAFQAAAASGQTGHSVSDKDVERFLKQVGRGGSDPMAVMRVLESTTNTVNKEFEDQYSQFSKGKPYPIDLKKPVFPDFGKSKLTESEQQELEALKAKHGVR